MRPRNPPGWPTLCGLCKGWAPRRSKSRRPAGGRPSRSGVFLKVDFGRWPSLTPRNLPGWPTLCAFCKGRAPLCVGVQPRPFEFSVPRIHLQKPFSSIPITPTAPRPISRMLHQLRLHRIRVHVVQLLRHLPARVNIQVKIPPLPESPQSIVIPRKRQGHLPFPRASSPSHPPRNSLLEHLNDLRWRAGAALADQQVDMFGHNHIADQRKPIPHAHFAENLHNNISRAHAAQQSSSLIAAKCDEMQVAKPSDAFQTFRHSERSERPTLCKNRKG